MRACALIVVVIVLGLSVAGCDKCGDYFWQNGQKSCHNEAPVK